MEDLERFEMLDVESRGFEKQINEWKSYNERIRKHYFVGGILVGILAGVFIIGFVFCQILPTMPEVVERPTGVTIAEYKQAVKSLDRCNEHERELVEDETQTTYTWDRLMMLEHMMDDAPGDFDRIEANRICERCEEDAEEKWLDCKWDRDDDCWCPFDDSEAYGPVDPCDSLTNLDMENMLNNMCTELEGGTGETSSPLGLAWMMGCVGVKGRESRDFDAFFPDYEWGAR